LIKGRVITRVREGVLVAFSENDQPVLCRVPSKGKGKRLKMPVPGDWVLCDPPSDTSDGWVQSIEPRSSLYRRYVFGRIKEIVSNIDKVFILGCPSNPVVSPRLIDRMLVAASVGSLEAVIVVNKSDLFSKDEVEEYCQPWKIAGYKVLVISALQRKGFESLETEFKGSESLLAGASGVGKSTLLNNLFEDFNLETAAVSKATKRGVHTTTYTYLYPFPGGGIVADSPGIREFHPVVEPEDLHLHFPEFQDLSEECDWRNCLHLAEPECAVRDAVGTELLHERRFDSYKKLYDSLREGPLRGRRQPG